MAKFLVSLFEFCCTMNALYDIGMRSQSCLGCRPVLSNNSSRIFKAFFSIRKHLNNLELNLKTELLIAC